MKGRWLPGGNGWRRCVAVDNSSGGGGVDEGSMVAGRSSSGRSGTSRRALPGLAMVSFGWTYVIFTKFVLGGARRKSSLARSLHITNLPRRRECPSCPSKRTQHKDTRRSRGSKNLVSSQPCIFPGLDRSSQIRVSAPCKVLEPSSQHSKVTDPRRRR